MEAERNFCQELSVEALHRAVPQDAIAAVLEETAVMLCAAPMAANPMSPTASHGVDTATRIATP